MFTGPDTTASLESDQATTDAPKPLFAETPTYKNLPARAEPTFSDELVCEVNKVQPEGSGEAISRSERSQ